MKRLLLLALSISGQTTFCQTYAVRSSAATCVDDILSLGKTNILNVGYPPTATISMAHGTLTKISSNLFQVAPYTTEGTDTLFIKKGAKTIFSRVFYIIPHERIKDYRAMAVWGNITADTATAVELANNLSRVHLDPDNGLYTLDSLCLSISPKRGDIVGPICSTSLTPSKEQIEILKNWRYQDRVWVEFIGHSLGTRKTRFGSYKMIVRPKN